MRILLGLSGGFDSAYAALKLKKQGHEVSGAILIMHEYTDVAGAESCAEKLGIPLYTIDCSEVFNSVVKTNFVDEYKNARTPNPCILCNERVKFRCLYDFAIENGFDAIATGHYANVQEIENGEEMRYTVSAAADQSKDQTYMLYRLPQDILSKLVLPMGDEMKSELRANAPEELVSVSEKAESQEICFIPDGDYASYIEALTGVFPKGNFVDDEGKILGTHNGIIRYTVGQRKGLGVSASSRLFVTDIDPVKNEIKLSDKGALTDTIVIRDVVYSGVMSEAVREGIDCLVKPRYHAPRVMCSARLMGDGTVVLKLRESMKASAPGQSAVAYDREGRVLFGGYID